MKWLALAALKVYQKLLSPLSPPRCRYYPSCSQYAVEAFRKHGFFKALGKSLWRVLRCNPWSDGGVDHP